MSDDELDLLRMAALQTIKQASEKSAVRTCKGALNAFNQYHHHLGRRKYPPFSGLKRGSQRNGQLNGRKITHTNLIPIQTMESPVAKDSSKADKLSKSLKLDLPQNRYCNKLRTDGSDADSKKESCKFSRYDDDSNSDSDNSDSEAESEGKLSRANSLDALMEELEAGITGAKPAVNKSTKTKRRSKVADVAPSVSDNDITPSDDQSAAVAVEKEKIEAAVELHCDTAVDDLIGDEPEADVPERTVDAHAQPVERSRTPEPPTKSQANLRPTEECKTLVKSSQRPPLLPKPRDLRNGYPEPYRHGAYPQYAPPPVSGYVPDVHAPFPGNNHLPATRPLSPLGLSQDAITTRVMAPLSPRSAAFVLQNRKIIEKRKRSPRHSYSRSPSPRARRSKSPRRQSRSPRRYARSSSPKRTSPGRRLRSPFKPRTRSPAERSPKRDVRERLTLNAKRTERAPSHEAPAKHKADHPERTDAKTEGRAAGEKDKDKDKDAVLAARRRKFEQQSSERKEGIIRLKTEAEAKTPEQASEPETTNTNESSQGDVEEEEAEALDADTLDTGIDDLFSDDESEDENEGRFKSSIRQRGDHQHVLTFSSLNKTANIANKALESNGGRARSNRDRCRRRGERGARESARKRRSSPASPTKDRLEAREERRGLRRDEDSLRRTRDAERGSDEKKSSAKTRSTASGRRVEMVDKTAKLDKSERVKIAEVEAKTKSEKNQSAKPSADADRTEKGESTKSRSSGGRKVAIAVDLKENKEEPPKDEVTVIDDDDEHDVLKKNAAGDLRAQLSRKRAERQSQKPAVTAEDVQSRLLHNALGAVFQKAKRSKRTEVEAAPKEKLPIHKRLGLNDESANQKKKIKRSTEQV